MRISEVLNLKISDIDSKRMMVRIENSKGNRDREVMLSENLLILLREYYKAYKPNRKDMSNNKIAENLKKLRAKKRLSLEKIARLADLSLNTIVKVENGVNTNPTIETLTKIARALEVGVDDLLK